MNDARIRQEAIQLRTGKLPHDLAKHVEAIFTLAGGVVHRTDDGVHWREPAGTIGGLTVKLELSEVASRRQPPQAVWLTVDEDGLPRTACDTRDAADRAAAEEGTRAYRYAPEL